MLLLTENNSGPSNAVMKFGPRIKSARRGAKLTQEELAQKVGVSQGAVYQWEKDITCPTTSNLADVALVTGVSFDWLATGREPGVVAEPDSEYAIRRALSDDERKMLEAYRSLSARKKKALLDLFKPET